MRPDIRSIGTRSVAALIAPDGTVRQPDVRVQHHRLGPTRGEVVAVGHAQRGVLVGDDDRARQFGLVRVGLRQPFDDRREVGPRVDEHDVDAESGQSGEHGTAGGEGRARRGWRAGASIGSGVTRRAVLARRRGYRRRGRDGRPRLAARRTAVSPSSRSGHAGEGCRPRGRPSPGPARSTARSTRSARYTLSSMSCVTNRIVLSRRCPHVEQHVLERRRGSERRPTRTVRPSAAGAADRRARGRSTTRCCMPPES